MGYLANFMVYTFAMAGIIAIALLLFKFTTGSGGIKKSKYLKIIDSMSLAPRKTLYIVSAGKEKFLIADDVDKTSLISKLETTAQEEPRFSPQQEEIKTSASPGESFRETMAKLPRKSYADKSVIGIKSSILHSSKEVPVIKNLAERIRG